MTYETAVMQALCRLVLVPLLVFGFLSIIASGGGGGDSPPPATFAVAGTVSGLAGAGLVLQNNGGDDLVISANGAFAFATPLPNGSAYNVTVLTQPTSPAQTCGVINGSGTLSGANVTIIAVSCPPAPVLSVSFALKQLLFDWTVSSGVTRYKLFENPDGVSGYTQIGGDLATTNAVLDIAVHRHNWANARYLVEACDGFSCTASNEVTTLDGMLQAIGYFKASDTEAQDNFGWSVALSADGNTLAVGAPLKNSGTVYVFTHSGGTWSQQAYVQASNTGDGDHFGETVVLSADGNTMAVGARFEDSAATGIDGDQTDNSALEAGAVYVFTRSGASWSQQAYIKASNTEDLDDFGWSLALSGDGDTLAAGAVGEDSTATGIDGNQADNSAHNAGAAYVYTRSGTTWSQQAYIKASNTERDDLFGESVALSADGSTLVVGATDEDSAAIGIDGNQTDNSLPDAGAVYVYTRSGTTWSQQVYIKASNTDPNDGFGESVALSADGSTLVVGVPDEDSAATGINGNQADNSGFQAGAAYLYTRSGATWSQQAYIKASNPDLGDGFGWSVALSEDSSTLAVRADREDSAATGIDGDQTDNSAPAAGAVYVYTRSGATWSQQAYVKASNTENADGYGGQFNRGSVALSGDGNTLAVGAPNEDSAATGIGGDQADNSAIIAGAVYLY